MDQAISRENRNSMMLVLSRKQLESVVVGGSNSLERMLKATVLQIHGGSVRLGFEVNTDLSVQRWEVWQRIRASGPPDPLSP